MSLGVSLFMETYSILDATNDEQFQKLESLSMFSRSFGTMKI